jgi:hypothetical protein
MWKRILELARLLFTLGEGFQQQRADLMELRREVRDLSAVVQKLSFEIRRTAENEAHEREKLTLRLANELLRFERRLPPATND